MHSVFWLSSALAAAACAANLADVCTTSYVQSVLPADNFIQGTTLSAGSVTASAVTNYTVPASSSNPGKSGLNFCNVTFSYSHTGYNDKVNLWFWLPAPPQFQNRYLSTGGGGLAITSGQNGLTAGVVHGAATGTTDGGFGGFSKQLSDVLLLADGTLNYNMLYSFGYKSIHEMSVLGKELTRKFYNSTNFYSYYSGCSEGGREGFSQVQRYGSQFDGAAVGAPAFRQAFQQVLHLFSAVVEKTNGYAPSPCELEKINNDTIAACDALDGRADGVVSRTDLCKLTYKHSASIGRHYSCPATSGGGYPGGPPAGLMPAANGTVTSQAVTVAEDIDKGLHDSKGRQVYISFQPSSGYPDAATTFDATTGKYEAVASGIGVQYVNLFLKEVNSASLSLSNVTYDILREWILEGMQKFSDTLQTTWPDLEDFQEGGGKIIHYHGESDNSVPAASSVMYQDSVRKTMYPELGFREGYSKLNDWYRLFLVPGAGHCAPSQQQPGPFPQDVLGSLISWVEQGVNPTLLNATVLSGPSAGTNQKLCAWPQRPFWIGSNMSCVYDQESIDSWLPNLNSIPVPVY
ncbi:tannase and feruloyl esterase [Coniochaeta ligniaria NRRL 30616]|uniref:Carboxylic ester hydrolase n=1 Tax=Coniochaeta ligniaria NRRL 30616 TaxID=1408157 RepID=A0A1J7I995_9PEZI|nr:tannase and feruloyl esterase [Coniochaeta ligniaria NRRL 30616]